MGKEVTMRYLIKKKGEKDICFHDTWGWVVWKPTTYDTQAQAEAVIQSKVSEGKMKPDEAVVTNVGDYKKN